MKQYQLNIEAELDNEEKQFLENISNSLESLFKTQNMNFDSSGFKTFVKKLYYKNTQFGGDEIVPYEGTKNVSKIKYDFFAIIGLLISIYFCWIAFIKINQLSLDTSGLSMTTISSQLSEDIQNAIQSVKNLPENEYTFLQFLYQSISSFSCSIVNSQIQNMQSFVTTAITNSIINAKDLIMESAITHCGMSTEVLNAEDWGMFGQLVNSLSAASTTLVSPDSTAQCIVTVTGAELNKLVYEQTYAISIMTAQLKTQSTQISALITRAAQLGGASVLYLSYRLSGIIKSRITNSSKTTKKITNYGGKKYRKTRKVRKTRKTRKTRNNKKANKK
jgi:hypothetical protein